MQIKRNRGYRKMVERWRRDWEKKHPQEFPQSKTGFADSLRRNMTKAELRLWRRLKLLGFRAQQVVQGYIPDFVHLKLRLCVEADGGYHAMREAYDSRRDGHLRQRGYRVLRFSNAQIIKHLTDVVAAVKSEMG